MKLPFLFLSLLGIANTSQAAITRHGKYVYATHDNHVNVYSIKTGKRVAQTLLPFTPVHISVGSELPTDLSVPFGSSDRPYFNVIGHATENATGVIYATYEIDVAQAGATYQPTSGTNLTMTPYPYQSTFFNAGSVLRYGDDDIDVLADESVVHLVNFADAHNHMHDIITGFNFQAKFLFGELGAGYFAARTNNLGNRFDQGFILSEPQRTSTVGAVAMYGKRKVFTADAEEIVHEGFSIFNMSAVMDASDNARQFVPLELPSDLFSSTNTTWGYDHSIAFVDGYLVLGFNRLVNQVARSGLIIYDVSNPASRAPMEPTPPMQLIHIDAVMHGHITAVDISLDGPTPVLLASTSKGGVHYFVGFAMDCITPETPIRFSTRAVFVEPASSTGLADAFFVNATHRASISSTDDEDMDIREGRFPSLVDRIASYAAASNSNDPYANYSPCSEQSMIKPDPAAPGPLVKPLRCIHDGCVIDHFITEKGNGTSFHDSSYVRANASEQLYLEYGCTTYQHAYAWRMSQTTYDLFGAIDGVDLDTYSDSFEKVYTWHPINLITRFVPRAICMPDYHENDTQVLIAVHGGGMLKSALDLPTIAPTTQSISTQAPTRSPTDAPTTEAPTLSPTDQAPFRNVTQAPSTPPSVEATRYPGPGNLVNATSSPTTRKGKESVSTIVFYFVVAFISIAVIMGLWYLTNVMIANEGFVELSQKVDEEQRLF